VSVEYVFTRADLQSVLLAIRANVVDRPAALDSPLRLEEALTTAVRRCGGDARITVRRSPAALVTPEYWRIEAADADEAACEALTELLAVTPR
jgi:hypothetical protein